MIRFLLKEINERMKESKEHINKAIMCKEKDDTSDAKIFYEIANDEMHHANMLYDMLVKHIDKIRQAGGNEYFLEMWDDEHMDYLNEITELKMMIERYSR